MIVNVSDKVFGCVIVAHQKRHYSTGGKALKKYDGYNFKQYQKWRWFFRYIQARYQIEYKDRFVELREFSYPKYDKKEMQKRGIKNKITATKGTITKYRNLIAKAKAAHNELFPFEQLDMYKKAMAKIERTEQKQRDLLKEYENYLIEL